VRRAIVNAVDALDWVVLSLPFARRLGGTCVMYGHAAPAGSTARVDAPGTAPGPVASRG
jgi:hypothetical protein